MKTIEYILCLAIFITLVSCNESSNNYEPRIETAGMAISFAANGDDGATKYKQVGGYINTGTTDSITLGTGQNQKTPDKIIKHGTVNMEVEHYNPSLVALRNLVIKANGYIANESENRSNYQINNHIVIRVPNETFDGLMSQTAGLAFELHQKQVSLTDVSEEFYDTKARLKSKRKVEERYLQILQKARTVEDILKVERELKNIREEIEAKEGRLKYLGDQVSYSTINLDMYQKLDYTPIIAKGEGFFARMGDGFSGGWKGLLAFIVGIAYLWPFLLAVAALAFVINRLIKRRRSHKLATN